MPGGGGGGGGGGNHNNNDDGQSLQEQQAARLRYTLASLSRLEMARAEDLKLMTAETSGDPDVATQAIWECELREEWRVQREDAAIRHIEGGVDLMQLALKKEKNQEQAVAPPPPPTSEATTTSPNAKRRSTGLPYSARERRVAVPARLGVDRARALREMQEEQDMQRVRSTTARHTHSPTRVAQPSFAGASRVYVVKGQGQRPQQSTGGPRPTSAPAAAKPKQPSTTHDRLLRSTRRLRTALAAHTEDDGATAAVTALRNGVEAARAAFADAVIAARARAAACTPSEREKPTPDVRRAWQPATALHRNLGTTAASLERAGQLRMRRAAQLVQRAWRVKLRRIKAERRRLAIGRLKLSARARRVQRAWRRFMARRRARNGALARLLYQSSARRLQRWWRRLRRLCASRVAPASSMPSADNRRAAAAALRITAAARGWIGRRIARRMRLASEGMALRTRRLDFARKRAVALALAPLDARLLSDCHTAHAEMISLEQAANTVPGKVWSAFDKWEKAARKTASRQPLPRGWVPQVDPATARLFFLNTRTGAFSRLHPAEAAAQPALAAGREKARAEVVRQIAQIESRADEVSWFLSRSLEASALSRRAVRARVVSSMASLIQ